MNKKTIRDVDLSGKRVLVRVDFNVPIENGVITDETRITAALPTLQAILAQRPQALVLMSHLGRPKDGVPDPKYSLRPVAAALEAHLKQPIAFVENPLSDEAVAQVNSLPEGSIVLLENTRFYVGETQNSPELAAQLAKFGDIYVNDAFGSAHRAHSSTEAIARLMPAVAGLLMEKELQYLSAALEAPVRPLIAILGGAKVSDKIKVIESLLAKADKLLIGGGMANTFLRAQGRATGASLVEENALDVARDLLAKGGDKLVLPTDFVIADAFKDDANTQIVSADQDVPEGWQILDIGPLTVERYAALLDQARTVIWNGPMGVFEMPNFAKGTNAIAQTLAALTDKGVITIIGGGDSAAAVQQAGLAERMTHISTGGGASLELLEGRVLPGVAALNDK
ncbi:MAG: phosphoglycerate kinase [Candidatus Thermofonsia Clade 1 bacterium]|jgi:phosphoglycerate kinase|uniref:Phosphoglycerate kinase n=1 Tax=Candidatus Thermofonsia Clade 1 bacterium TaxID=2364210 RepID=A0A2M8PIP3_9CHLR|nr:MAG: phosphoglycerate kinase [Candidatus Thermofonsia Clade 1 bacterium]PJF43184.1 MAG: phosphoglycerate kinase [Candidatus Thermofonsia Clade 1 bacterium]